MNTPFVRFMRLVEIGPERGDCWLWRGNLVRRYGHFSLSAVKTVKAHRWIYERIVGAIPEGHQIRHKCDVPACVNPDHLETGTAKQNIADKYERGRAPDRRGEKHPMAKIGPDDVLEIRKLASMGITHAVLAERYGLRRQYVSGLVSRRTWKHI